MAPSSGAYFLVSLVFLLQELCFPKPANHDVDCGVCYPIDQLEQQQRKGMGRQFLFGKTMQFLRGIYIRCSILEYIFLVSPY